MDCQNVCSAAGDLDPVLQGMLNFAMTLPAAVLVLAFVRFARWAYRWHQRRHPATED